VKGFIDGTFDKDTGETFVSLGNFVAPGNVTGDSRGMVNLEETLPTPFPLLILKNLFATSTPLAS